MFGAMTAKALLGWLTYFRAEPWRDEAAGLRIGLLASATAELPPQSSPADFVVSGPTGKERRRREDIERQTADHDRWLIECRRKAEERKADRERGVR